MAKIEYSALVNRIRGRVSHSVLSNWKGIGIIKRHNAGVHQPRSAEQQDVRGFLNDLAGEYYSLTAIQKELWDSWVAMFKLPMSGLNAYVKFNQILQKYLPGSTKKTAPPSTPATPEHARGLTATAITGLDFCIAWTSPTAAGDVMIVDKWAMPGRDSVTNPRWAFAASGDSDALVVGVTGDYPVGTVVKFRVRNMDTDGRVSPWSQTLSATTIT